MNMNMRIHKIVNSVFASNTYVLSEETSRNCWLIDVGDIEPIIDFVKNRVVKGVFITHSHYDHIYGIRQIMEMYPDCLIYTNEEGRIGMASDKFNFSRYHGDPISFTHRNISVLNNGETVELYPGCLMKATYTPGHDRSCLTYYTDEYVFSGDSYIPGFEVVTTFPRSNKEDSSESLKKIYQLLETRKIKPGHQ